MNTANIMELFCLFDVSFIFFCLKVEIESTYMTEKKKNSSS